MVRSQGARGTVLFIQSSESEWLAEEKNAEARQSATQARTEATQDPNPQLLLETMDKAMAAWPALGKR